MKRFFDKAEGTPLAWRKRWKVDLGSDGRPYGTSRTIRAWAGRTESSLALLVLLLGSILTPLLAQDPPRRKPVLIRADKTEEPEAEATIVTPNPLEASHHQKVGDFYFRRKNYKAAAERYRDAVLFDPKSPDRVVKLIRALEKLKLFGEAAQACEDYLERNPGAPQEEEFRERARKLQEKEQESG